MQTAYYLAREECNSDGSIVSYNVRFTIFVQIYFHAACSRDEYQCFPYGECIPIAEFCDGWEDCRVGMEDSDERNCGKSFCVNVSHIHLMVSQVIITLFSHFTNQSAVATHFEKITHFEKVFQSALNLGPAQRTLNFFFSECVNQVHIYIFFHFALSTN